MSHKAISAVVYEPGGPFVLENVGLDDLRPNEVLVRIEACGICHTDLKFQSRLPLPGVFGHEGTGTVTAFGSNVEDLCVGDRVILSYPWCGECPSCAKTEPYRCTDIPQLKFSGRRMDRSATIKLNGKPITSAFFQQSSFSTYAIALDQTVVKVETDQSAAMLAALPCGVQTGAGAVLNTFNIQKGESLVVLGVGAVGLSAVMAGKLVGASPIIAVDMFQPRLDLAMELGADQSFIASSPDLLTVIAELLPYGADYALDCSATVSALKNALEMIGQGGKVGIFSAPPPGQTFEFTTRPLFEKVASMHSIVQGYSVPRNFIPELIRYQEEGRFPYEKLITTYNFSDINQAINDTKSGAVVKPVLLMDEFFE